MEPDKQRGVSNRKNGKTMKKVKGLTAGEFELESTRDRLGTFNSNIVPKGRLIITEDLENKILSMYAMGMSTRSMSDYVWDICTKWKFQLQRFPG